MNRFRTGMEGPPALSVVIPVHNEQANLLELHRRLDSAMKTQPGRCEFLFVDDGSSDDTFEVLRRLHGLDDRVIVLRLSRNFGHYRAITAGLDEARGAFVAVMDGDLQDPPESLPILLAKAAEGYDLVYAIRAEHQGGAFKAMTSALFWRLLRRVSALDIPPGQSMLRVMSRPFVDALMHNREASRFLIGLMAHVGYRQTGIVVPHGRRFAGRSSYGLGRMFGLAANAVVSTSRSPVQFFLVLGMLVLAASIIVAGMLAVRALGGGDVAPSAILWTLLFALCGLQMIGTGVLGQYLCATLDESRGRQLYVVASRLPPRPGDCGA